MSALSLYDKLWNLHTVQVQHSGATLLYVDVHFVHEVTSPQAFSNIKEAEISVRCPQSILGTPDHNIETLGPRTIGTNFGAQIKTLSSNCSVNLVDCSEPFDDKQGIVHVVGAEQCFAVPSKSVACGDSHTSTHGAVGCLAQGIGTSEVENILATQTLLQKRNRNVLINIEGKLGMGCSSKDIVLQLIKTISTAGGTGYSIEFGGGLVQSFSPEERMTVCNMVIEAGSKFGLVGTDNTTLNYYRYRSSPTSDAKSLQEWKMVGSDLRAQFSKVLNLHLSTLCPQVTWGTLPEMVVPISGRIPNPKAIANSDKRKSYEDALKYSSLQPNMLVSDITVDYVFIGSCTNSRIEDLRIVAKVIEAVNQRIAKNIRGAIIVPGSGLVKRQAESEGLDVIIRRAGFEWRDPGCSMCIAMNNDKLLQYERCASTSNRNFESRQGQLSRTHLVSPATAALAALTGRFSDVRGILR